MPPPTALVIAAPINPNTTVRRDIRPRREGDDGVEEARGESNSGANNEEDEGVLDSDSVVGGECAEGCWPGVLGKAAGDAS